MSDETCPWTGASGTDYIYYVFERHPDVPSRPGNFIYALKNPEGLWVPVYVGEGDLAVRGTGDPELIACVDAKGATHVHLRLNSRKQDREEEVRDLLARYLNAFAPYGCHSPQGG